MSLVSLVNRIIFCVFVTILPNLAYCQEVSFNGFAVDQVSGERIIGATVYAPKLQKGTQTDGYGYFSMKLPKNFMDRLSVSSLGYEKETVTFTGLIDTLVTIKLSPLDLPEFTVQASKKRISFGLNSITISSPSFLPYPSLKTEIDILDVVRQMPGVQPGLEGTTGFSVRGGNNDQNLLLMDHIPLYNTAHLANFISIFDPYTINSMTVYKGGFPAYYGGRASSVIDIYLKEGSKSNMGGEVILGPIFSKIALEGPILKGKTSYLFSLRRSMTDLLLGGVNLLTQPDSKFQYSFYDLNFKFSHRIKDGSDVYLSFYSGRDKLTTDGERGFGIGDGIRRTVANFEGNSWGNTSVSLRWAKVLNKSLFFNSVLAYSHFNYRINSEDKTTDNETLFQRNFFDFAAKVNDLLFKNELDWQINRNLGIKTGVQLTRHFFEPIDWVEERFRLGGAFQSQSRSQVRLNGTEAAFFVQSKLNLANDKLVLYPGMRLGLYALDGGFIQPLFEPRFRSAYRFSENSQIMFSFSRMNQTVHSLNTSGVALLPDIWVPATERLRPTTSDEVSMGWDKFFQRFGLNGQFGLYYRQMRNLIQFDGNTGFATIQDQWDEAIINEGQGYAYGLEMSFDKSLKNFQLDMNYTFSRSFRRFDQINNGDFFPHIFDRPHNTSLTGVWKINEKTNISALWTYQTGQPITLGSQLFPAINNHYFYGGLFSSPQNIRSGNTQLSFPYQNVFENPLLLSETNNYRMPDFHRLDVSLSHEKVWRNGMRRRLNLSVYNAYNRQNPYFIYAVREDVGIRFKKLTLFPILPSISYGVRF